MRRFTLALTCAVALGLAGGAADARTILHVAPDGNDSWSGNLSRPNAAGTDGPKRTLNGARLDLRQRRNAGTLSPAGATVLFQPGRYEFSSRVQFWGADGGSPGAPIVYKGTEPGRVIFDGTRAVSGWGTPGRSDSLPLPEQTRRHVFVTSLPAQGITNFGRFATTTSRSDHHAPLRLLVPNEDTRMARWPNFGWIALQESGSRAFVGPRPARWRTAPVFVNGFHYYNWAAQNSLSTAIDSNGRITAPASYNAFRSGQRVFFENIPEELDLPGEYYLDRANGFLYYYPARPDYSDLDHTRVSVLNQEFINLTDVPNLVFESISFYGGNGRAITGSGSNLVLRDLRFSELGTTAIELTATNSLIENNEFSHLGMGAIALSGGQRNALVASGNVIRNNTFRSLARRIPTHNAVRLTGHGHRVESNLFIDLPGLAVDLASGGHVVDNNDFFFVCLEVGDAGAIYSHGRDARDRGHVITNNRFFHVRNNILNPSHYSRVHGIYFDDYSSSNRIENNHFEEMDMGILLGGGMFNIVNNNVFVNNGLPARVDDRGVTWGQNPAIQFNWQNQLEQVNFTQGPWAQRFPELLTFFEGDTRRPIGTQFHNNRIVGTSGIRWERNAPRDEVGTVLGLSTTGVTLLAPQLSSYASELGILLNLRNLQERPDGSGSAGEGRGLVQRDGFWVAGNGGTGPRTTPIGRQNGGGTMTP